MVDLSIVTLVYQRVYGKHMENTMNILGIWDLNGEKWG